MAGYAIQRLAPVPSGMKQRSVTHPVWAALREAAQPLTVNDLHRRTAAPPQAIYRVCRSWERGGLVVSAGYPRSYAMSEVGAAKRLPPVIASRAKVVDRQPNARQRCWTAMGVLKRFDMPTLEIAASASHAAAQTYLNALVRAGYVRVAMPGCARRGEHAVYHLIRRTGPKAPVLTHSRRTGRHVVTVRDPNTGASVDLTAAESARGVNHVC